MEIKIPLEFIHICNEIAKKNLSLDDWKKIESSDMFQTKRFDGGFDVLEQAFCFSYYDLEGNEFWFQITLEEVNQIIKGDKTNIDLKPAS